jgi:hypothetical protein
MRRLITMASLAWFLALPALAAPSRPGLSPLPRAIVLFSSLDPPEVRRLSCPAGRCLFRDLEGFRCDLVEPRIPVVIVSGHSLPPLYLSHSPAELAAAIRCFAPELVVLDTCYGFSLPLLDELAATGPELLIVGATYRLPPEGLLYQTDLFAPGSAARHAAAIQTRSGARLERWRSSPIELDRAHAELDRWGPERLTASLRRVHPNLVLVPITPAVEALFEVPPARFGLNKVKP